MRLTLAAATLALLPAALFADDVTDTIESALAAYQEGDIAYAEEELTFALQLMKQLKAASLADLLPAAPDGWTRQEDPSAAQGFAMMGGAAASAEYSNGSESFTLTILIDNPMMASMGAIVANPAMAAASGGELLRVGREKFVAQDNQLIGLIDNRAMVQAEGASRAAMLAVIETMDFGALGDFGN